MMGGIQHLRQVGDHMGEKKSTSQGQEGETMAPSYGFTV